jgi:peptidoglycan hydrolase-like protein with peptidoglycan-binding domain
MRLLTIAACLTLACAPLAGAAGPVPGNQSATPAAAAASAQPKKHSSHKHRRTSKRQPGQKAPTTDRISEIQASLARQGYYHADPNGKFDANTVAALQKFQSANDLDATGKLDAPTLQKLGLGSDIAGVAAPKPVVPSCCSVASPGSGSTTGSTAPACCSLPPASQAKPAIPSADPASNSPSGATATDPKPDEK